MEKINSDFRIIYAFLALDDVRKNSNNDEFVNEYEFISKILTLKSGENSCLAPCISVLTFYKHFKFC